MEGINRAPSRPDDRSRTAGRRFLPQADFETARHNVITAYGGSVGLELLRRFPNVDTAVVHTELADSSFKEIVRELKKIRPDLPVIGISPAADRQTEGADYVLSSFDPEGLLKLLAERFEASTSDDG